MNEKKEEVYSNKPVTSPVPLIYENLESTVGSKSSITMMLDDIESQVEQLRRRAFQVEEERDAMFSALHAFKHSLVVEDLDDVDRDDILNNIDRIYARCSTIDVCVKTVRDEPQVEALHKVNGIIDCLITELHHDPTASKAKCLSFMNSCTSYSENGFEDRNFEQAILECTVDDQKRVRRRLQGLMNYIEKLSLAM